MKRNYTIVSLAFIVCFIAGFWVGCIVDYDDQLEEVYACTEDSHCIQPAFVCGPNNLCIRYQGPPVAVCVDEDGDGYGADGTDRSTCPNPEPDCDDTDPTVYPGAPEVCDGKLNNCNASEVDVAPCERQSDCPQNQEDPEGNRITFSCEENRCVAKAPKQICLGGTPCPECALELECREGVLDVVPLTCR